MGINSFNAYSSLETVHTILRKLVPQDAAEIFTLRSDDRVNEFLERPAMHTIEEADAFIVRINNGIDGREWLYWAIRLKEMPHKMIGTVCLWNFSGDMSVAEIGYELDPLLQGKGIMREVIVKIVELAFSYLKLKAITAYVHPKNNRSARLLQNAGFNLTTERKYVRGVDENVVYVLEMGQAKNMT